GEPARLATVFLGSELGRTLHVKVGDRVRLIIPRARLSPFTVRPRSVSYVVAGFADSGFYDFDTTRLYMHLDEAQRLFSMGDTVTAVQVRLDDLDHTARVRSELESRLGGAFYVNDLMEQNRAFFSALRLEKMVAFLVITLIVLVAALNIVSTLILMVMEKVRDIGALVSMGATSRSVMMVFQLQGLIIGVVGTLVGLVLGIGVSWVMDTYRLWTLNPDVYFIPYLPFKVRPLDFTLTALIAVLISFQATLYPSWRASRLDPVEALRNE
ncbi:MAG: FtsX-like permease family protein, partial [Acidobacteriota bacterium]